VADPEVRFLHAAADPTRLAILRELSSEGPIRACDLTSCCNVHQPTVSHHLRVLREAGWVRAERHGTSISYELCADAVERFRQIAGELRPGSECARTPGQWDAFDGRPAGPRAHAAGALPLHRRSVLIRGKKEP
jgi:ArsR family transcriptional regulator